MVKIERNLLTSLTRMLDISGRYNDYYDLYKVPGGYRVAVNRDTLPKGSTVVAVTSRNPAYDKQVAVVIDEQELKK